MQAQKLQKAKIIWPYLIVEFVFFSILLRRKWESIFNFCFLLFFANYAHAEINIAVQSVRLWPSPEGTRVVFDVSNQVNHRVFTLKDPARLVVDLDNSYLNFPLANLALDNTSIKKIRYGALDANKLRIVFDLEQEVIPKSFILRPSGGYGDRLVIDLLKRQQEITQNYRPVHKLTSNNQEFIIAIDAGHGGEDPGAIGRKGTKEKDIALKTAKILAARINQEPNMRAVLIRDGDYYVSLRNRIAKARLAQADLFISLHADSFKNVEAKGASIFILSDHGATSEAARWLAERENQSDLIGGISLEDKDNLLASVLLDLSQTASFEASFRVANQVLSEINNITVLHGREVQQAGFVVLKSPDIPSLLVEMGFISNSSEEKKLKSNAYQQELVAAITKGITAYFRNKSKLIVLDDKKYNHNYQVVKGDTLSSIARKFNISIARLKETNSLNTEMLRIGQKLQVPY